MSAAETATATVTFDLAAIRADLDRLIGREHAAAQITAPGREAFATARVEQGFAALYPALAALRHIGPQPAPTVPVPAHLLKSALADARCQRDRARGEDALCAPADTPLARVGDTRVAIWAAHNAGIAALLEWATPP